MVSDIEGILRWPVFRLSKICVQIAGGVGGGKGEGGLDSSQQSTAAAAPPRARGFDNYIQTPNRTSRIRRHVERSVRSRKDR
jgi:hypothetical protein